MSLSLTGMYTEFSGKRSLIFTNKQSDDNISRRQIMELRSIRDFLSLSKMSSVSTGLKSLELTRVFFF